MDDLLKNGRTKEATQHIPQWTTHVGHGPPPTASWKIWKHAISLTFLTKDRTNVYYPLNTPLKRIPKARRPRTRKQPQLQDVINALSEYYKEVLGTYKLPDDNGNAILQQLQSKTGTKSWTDGTVKDGKGAHAYTIRPQAPNTPGLSIEGKSMTPGNPRTISSLQPEHYVSNSTITTLKSNKHHLPKSSDPEGNIEY